MNWRKAIAWLALLVTIGFFTIWWTMGPEPMKVAKAYSVNDWGMKDKVLIATQGSKFKDELVKEVIAQLKILPVFIQVIDISGLESADVEDWSATVIIHSIEYWKPQQHVKDFVDQAGDKHKLVILSTSGEGNAKFEGIDAISSASRLSEVPEKSTEIVKRVKAIIRQNDLTVES